jgi:hypothetical protein
MRPLTLSAPGTLDGMASARLVRPLSLSASSASLGPLVLASASTASLFLVRSAAFLQLARPADRTMAPKSESRRTEEVLFMGRLVSGAPRGVHAGRVVIG